MYWIDHAKVVTEGIEVVVQHINMLLKVILPVLNLLILLLCRQSTRLCTESINVTMQPLDTLKTGHNRLIHSGVKVLSELLKISVHVTATAAPRCENLATSAAEYSIEQRMCSMCSACSKSRGQSNREKVSIHAPEDLAPSMAELDPHHHPCAHHQL
jgi:hypothetical protein